MKRTGLEIKKILPDQHDRPAFRGSPGQGQNHAAGRRRIRRLDSVEFMQGGAGQTAVQGLIQRWQAKGNPGRMPGRICRQGTRRKQRPRQPEASESEIGRRISHRGKHDFVPVMF